MSMLSTSKRKRCACYVRVCAAVMFRLSLLGLGKPKEALEALVDVLDRQLHIPTLNNRGIIHRVNGDLDAALNDFSQWFLRSAPHAQKKKQFADFLRSVDAGYADAHVNRALTYLDRGDARAAHVDLTKAIALNPTPRKFRIRTFERSR